MTTSGLSDTILINTCSPVCAFGRAGLRWGAIRVTGWVTGVPRLAGGTVTPATRPPPAILVTGGFAVGLGLGANSERTGGKTAGATITNNAMATATELKSHERRHSADRP